jgi:Raf kinase inhibitor-like YbhB/YbcL family protein
MVGGLPSFLGRLLRKFRPGVAKCLIHDSAFNGIPANIRIESGAIDPDGSIGRPYTDDGTGLSPPLSWHGVPWNALSLALVIEDADSPTLVPFVHLLAWKLPARYRAFDAGSFKSKKHPGQNLELGRNGLGKCEYTPPDPLPGHGRHQYVVQLFALDRSLQFKAPPTRAHLKAAMQGHVVSKGLLIGSYERP